MMIGLWLLRATQVSIWCCLAIAIVTFSGCTGTFSWKLRPCIKELTKEQLRHFEGAYTCTCISVGSEGKSSAVGGAAL